jgi:xanthine/uracil/vitamin C permease (AzgA family)
MPFTFSITNGIAFGLVAYGVGSLFRRKRDNGGEVS